MEIITLENVVKKFGDYVAVDHISFSIEKGKIFGILGPNGAGKTTTIRMITNIFMPDEGTIKMNGEIVNPKHQNIIGYLPEERGLYKRLKVIDQLVYFGKLKGLTKDEALANSRNWLKKMGAESWENKKIQELSKGMQQKVQFISTILHSPEVLILDEPFSGFDPINTELLKNIILDLKKEGITILLSTHIMEQAEQLCDEIILINKGKAVLSGNVRETKQKYGKDSVLLEFNGDDSFLNKFRDLKFINRTHNRVEFRIPNFELAKEILHSAIDNVEIFKYELSEPSLHEIFIDVVSKEGNNDETDN